MQRFKIGSQVEILRKKNVPPGMWRSAEVVEENGDNCIVRYDSGLGVGGEGTFQRVPWESIRPCPPPVKAVVSWEVGDVIEVLDFGHWKVAVIINIMEGGYYCIKLIGSLEEFVVQKSSIRVRQVWSDNKWVVIGKDSRTGKRTGKCVMSKVPGWTLEQTGDDFQVLPSRISKRALPDLDAYTTNFSKKRAVEKRGRLGRFLPGCSFLFMKKVDAAAYSKENMGGNLIHPNVSVTANNELYRGKQTGALFYDKIAELNDSISTVSSVGSCGDVSCNVSNSFVHCNKDTNALYGDAESYHSSGEYEESFAHPFGEEYGGALTPGLQAHNGCLGRLHFSGPSNWEEVYLSDLHNNLHISNDDVLSEIRNL